MGTDPIYEKLRELSWRRKLTDAEERELREWLAAHPEAVESFDLESGLTEALAKIPDAAVASNFTSRVLQTVQREAMAHARGEREGWKIWRRFPRWMPRVASAAVVIIAAASVYLYHSNVEARHAIAAQWVAGMPLPSPEILTNFEAIRIVSATPAPDEQLLALFQ